MIVDAPAIRAPCTAERPIGPQPTTATLDAGSIAVSPWVAVAPKPGDARAAADHADLGSRLAS